MFSRRVMANRKAPTQTDCIAQYQQLPPATISPANRMLTNTLYVPQSPGRWHTIHVGLSAYFGLAVLYLADDPEHQHTMR